MLATTNTVVNIKRFQEIDGESNYIDYLTDLAVYIEPIEEEIQVTFEGQGAYEGFRLMSANTTLEIGDMVVEGTQKYKILGKRVFNSIVGTHIECVIQSQYD